MNRKRLLARVGLSLLAVLVVAAGVGGGYAWGRSGAPSTSTLAAESSTAPPPTPTAAAKSTKKASPAVRGQLTAASGDDWRVQTAKDGAFIVTLSSTTTFGTEKKPAARTDFTVGSSVVVTGAKTGDAIAATRIAIAQPKASGTPTPSATPAPAPTPTS